MKTYVAIRFEYGCVSNAKRAIRKSTKRLNKKNEGLYVDFAETNNCKVWGFASLSKRDRFINRLNSWIDRGLFDHAISAEDLDGSMSAAEWSEWLNEMQEEQIENEFVDGRYGDALQDFCNDAPTQPSEEQFRDFYTTLGLPERFYSTMMEVIEANYSTEWD